MTAVTEHAHQSDHGVRRPGEEPEQHHAADHSRQPAAGGGGRDSDGPGEGWSREESAHLCIVMHRYTIKELGMQLEILAHFLGIGDFSCARPVTLSP